MAAPFRLQSVLKLREAAQRDRQQDLAQVVQAEQLLAKQQQALEQELQNLEQELRLAQRDSINIDTLTGLRRSIGDVRLSLQQLAAQQDEVDKEMERRQLRLAQANREVQVMEKLKEHQHQQQVYQQQSEEQKTLDEFRPLKR